MAVDHWSSGKANAMYRLIVFVDDHVRQVVCAEDEAGLRVLMRQLAIVWADKGKVSMSAFDLAQQTPYHPAGKAMPEGWNGVLPVKVTVNVGSAVV